MSEEPDYTLTPYITPYLREIEKLLFEHRGHTLISILRDHDLEITCATCSKRVFLKPILVYRVPVVNTPASNIPPTQLDPD